MSALARPSVFAAVLAAAALVLHPSIGAARWRPGQPAFLAALALLAVLALAARAAGARERRLAAIAAAAGAAVLVGALGLDGLRGHHGTLTLAPGQSLGNFDEEDGTGRSLGLRPLGFAVGAERVSEGGVALVFSGSGGAAGLTTARSVAHRGYRFAKPRVAASGGAARLRIAAAGDEGTLVGRRGSRGSRAASATSRSPSRTYFPDFALDEQRQPYSRSAEPRNPAALLTIEKEGKAHRAFVLQSMPGVHRVEGLGLAFSLLAVEEERAAEIAVHREPAALLALVGALVLAVGLALSWPWRSAGGSGGDPDAPPLVAGLGLLGALVLADRGGVLAWTFGVTAGTGRERLAGVGVLLGGAVVTALAGSLLLTARTLAGGHEGARPAGRAALGLAAVLTVAGLALAAYRVASLAGDLDRASRLACVGLGGAVAILFGALLLTRPAAPPWLRRLGALSLPAAVLATLALAIALGSPACPGRHLRHPGRRGGGRNRAPGALGARGDGRCRRATPRLPPRAPRSRIPLA